MEKKKQTGLRLPPILWDKVRKDAIDAGITASAFVERILLMFYRRKGKKP
jgi:hypothetical protein